MRAKFQESPNGKGGEEKDSALVGVNAACGICVAYPMQQPMVISPCMHAFCFGCLKDVYEFRKIDSVDDFWKAPDQCEQHDLSTFQPEPNNHSGKNKNCPLCRQFMNKSSIENFLQKAEWYTTQGKRASGSVRTELFNKALTPLDTVLKKDPEYMVFLLVKAKIMLEISPVESIALVNKLLATDQSYYDMMTKYTKWVKDRRRIGNEESKEMKEFREKCDISYKPLQTLLIGKGPRRLISVQILLAQSHEAAGLWDKAGILYENICAQAFSTEDLYPSMSEVFQLCSIYSGISHCFFNLGDYERAIDMAHVVCCVYRRFPGVHKLIAMSQRALNAAATATAALATSSSKTASAKSTSAAARKKKQKHPFLRQSGFNASKAAACASAMGTDAILTMRRGIVYEEPWNAVNRLLNQSYLQELIDEEGDVTKKSSGKER